MFDDVTLDCAGTLTGWQTVGDYEWTRIDLMRHDFVPQGNCSTGPHEMKSEGLFGLWVWGWGSPETTSDHQVRLVRLPGRDERTAVQQRGDPAHGAVTLGRRRTRRPNSVWALPVIAWAQGRTMRLGIDFGTTRTVVACCDRGNYPVVTFQDEGGNPVDWYPSVVAERRGRAALRLRRARGRADPEWTVLRSFKRLLSGPAIGARLRGPARRHHALRRRARSRASSSRCATPCSPGPTARARPPATTTALDAVVATPANAHGTQRFVTLDAFRRAGFEVTGDAQRALGRGLRVHPPLPQTPSPRGASTSSSTTWAAAPSTPRWST